MPKITKNLNIANVESSKDSLLLHLKSHNELTVPQLCELLEITSMAVRRHLSEFISGGLIQSRLVKQPMGRPIYVYRLTAKANSLFPSNFQNLAKELLQVVYKQYGHKGVMDLLSKRDEERLKEYKDRLLHKTLKEKIIEVVKIFADDGYMTDFEEIDAGNFIIYQKNCALHDIAKNYRQLCILEPRFMENLLGVKVVRKQYMLKNSPVCAYYIANDESSIELPI